MFTKFGLIEYTVPFDEFPAFLMAPVDCIITSGCAPWPSKRKEAYLK